MPDTAETPTTPYGRITLRSFVLGLLCAGCVISSILIGRVCKVLVSKYGNNDTYGRFRYSFIGLIVRALPIRGGSGAALDDQPHLWSM
jgi:hypothetical protein